MPTYQYACTACGHDFDVVQSFSDDPLTDCPECQGRLRKVFAPVGVVFKGSGFYRTDSRGSAGGGGSKAKSDTGTTTDSSGDKAPAAAPAADSAASSASTPKPASSDSAA